MERLTRYYQSVRDRTSAEAVISAHIAEWVQVDDTQVRRDLHSIGVRGVPHVGFRRSDILSAIRGVLSFYGPHRAIIVGAGRLGGAIANYPGFSDHGMQVVAIFDTDPGKIGTSLAGCKVLHDDEMESVIKRKKARMAVITVPGDVAQRCADRVVASGIRSIWNFAPTEILVPSNVVVRDERLAVGLAVLTHHLGKTS